MDLFSFKNEKYNSLETSLAQKQHSPMSVYSTIVILSRICEKQNPDWEMGIFLMVGGIVRYHNDD